MQFAIKFKKWCTYILIGTPYTIYSPAANGAGAE